MFGVELLWWVGCLCSCWHNQKPGSLVHKWVTRFSESENMNKTFIATYFASRKVKIWAKKVILSDQKLSLTCYFASRKVKIWEKKVFSLSTFCFQLDDNYGWIDERKEITTLYKDWIQVEPFQHFPGYPLWSVDLPTKKELLWQQQTFWEEFSLGHPPWNSCHMLFRTLLFFQLLFPQPLWLTSTALSQASFQVDPNGEWPGVGCHL